MNIKKLSIAIESGKRNLVIVAERVNDIEEEILNGILDFNDVRRLINDVKSLSHDMEDVISVFE